MNDEKPMYYIIINKLDNKVEVFDVFESYLSRLHKINIATERNRFTIEEIGEEDMYDMVYALVHEREALYPGYKIVFHHTEE